MADDNNKMTYMILEEKAGPLEYREKASRFLGYVETCESIDEASCILQQFRKKYFDATHVCYAFRLRDEQQEVKRTSDDGEPSGTAGLPILQEILAKDLWNVLVMVVRYYGGTKLGTGGLVRAYATAAKAALDACKLKQMECMLTGTLSFPFTDTGLVMHWLNRFRGTTMEQSYTEQGMNMICRLPRQDAAEAQHALVDMSAGRLSWTEIKG